MLTGYKFVRRLKQTLHVIDSYVTIDKVDIHVSIFICPWWALTDRFILRRVFICMWKWSINHESIQLFVYQQQY